eukprot:jgi/Botrbrau1/22236/Bobra.0718s0001.1
MAAGDEGIVFVAVDDSEASDKALQYAIEHQYRSGNSVSSGSCCIRCARPRRSKNHRLYGIFQRQASQGVRSNRKAFRICLEKSPIFRTKP